MNRVKRNKKTMTTEQFIERAKSIHGDKFCYNLTNYINTTIKVEIICFNCKDSFIQTFTNHITNKYGCNKCRNVNKINKIDFITKAKAVHGDKYNYSQSVYKGNKQKIDIICPIHGPFSQRAGNHIFLARGCSKCGTQKGVEANFKSTEYFINKSKEIYGNKYDYSKSIYKGKRGKLCITCRKHGDFYIIPEQHYDGYECVKCKQLDKYSFDDFLKDANEIYGNYFDYSKAKTKFINISTVIEIICKEHGPFSQTPTNHLKGYICPSCSCSQGEARIIVNLKKYQIGYKREYRIKECMDKRCLPFDFHIPSKNVLIEYQGQQHFYPVNFGGKCGIKNHLKTVEHDKIKKEFCLKNKIKLIEIPFTEFNNIENIIVYNFCQ